MSKMTLKWLAGNVVFLIGLVLIGIILWAAWLSSFRILDLAAALNDGLDGLAGGLLLYGVILLGAGLIVIGFRIASSANKAPLERPHD